MTRATGSPADPAFVALLEATHDRIRSYVAGTGVPLDEVDDIAQEVFVAYHRDSHRRPSEVEPLAWLRGIARNRCNDYFREKGRASRHWQEMARSLELETSPLEHPTTDEGQLTALSGCIQGLPDRYQNMLRWYYQDDLSADEIGKRLERSAGAIRVAMLRLRETLRACIDRHMAEEQVG